MTSVSRFERPFKVQIAFQGGGAKLYSLIAAADAIRALEEENIIEVRRVAGSSAGAIVAALYAAKVPIEEAIKVFSVLPNGLDLNSLKKIKDFIEIFSSEEKCKFIKRKKRKCFGFFKYMGAYFVLKSVCGKIKGEESLIDVKADSLKEKLCEFDGIVGKDIKCFKDVKLVITRTDIERKGAKCSDDDSVVGSLLDSCRIPLIFDSTNINRFDGGITVNLPTNLLINEIDEYGHVIAITFKDKVRNYKDGFDKMLSLISSVFNAGVNINKNDKRVLCVEIEDDGVGLFDFEKMAAILKSIGSGDDSEDSRLYKKAYDEVFKKVHDEFKFKNRAIRLSLDNRLNNLCTNMPLIKSNIAGKGRYSHTIISYPYTNIVSVGEMQGFLSEKIKEANNSWGKIEFEDAYFDAMQRPEIAVLNKALYLFPFLLSRLRRNYWGVIDYGRHRAVGMIVGERFKFKSVVESHGYVRSDSAVAKYDLKGIHWFSDLINKVNSKNGWFYSVAGYMYNEFMPLMLMENGEGRAMESILNMENKAIFDPSQYDGCIEGFDGDFDEKMLGVFSRKEVALLKMYSRMLEKFLEKDNGHSFVVYDLAHDYLIDFLIVNKGFPVVRKALKHYLEIMVGIGFSLPALDDIGDDFWYSIKSNAFSALDGSESDLFDVGIQLNKNGG